MLACIFASCILFISNTVPGLCQAKDFNIIGTWDGIDGTNAKGTYIFHNDSTVILIVNGDTINPKNSKFTFNVNYSIEPISLDLLIKNIQSGREDYLRFIMKILSNDKIMLASADLPTEKPLNFDKKSNTIVLNRRK